MSKSEVKRLNIQKGRPMMEGYKPDYDARDETIAFYMEQLKHANERNERLKAYTVELETKLPSPTNLDHRLYASEMMSMEHKAANVWFDSKASWMDASEVTNEQLHGLVLAAHLAGAEWYDRLCKT